MTVFHLMTTKNKVTLESFSEDMHCRVSKGASGNMDKGSHRDKGYWPKRKSNEEMGYREERHRTPTQSLRHSMQEATLLGTSSARHALKDRGIGNQGQKLLKLCHLHRASFDSEAVFPEDKRRHLASDAWRWKKSDYRPHCEVSRELIYGAIWIMTVRSGGGRSTATFFVGKVGGSKRAKLLMVYHLHRTPSRPKTVFRKSQRCHSVSNT